MKALLPALLLLGACAASPERAGDQAFDFEHPQTVDPDAAHAWLEQFLGDWHGVSDAPGEDDEVTWEFDESAEAVGKLWIVARSSSPESDPPFASVLTLGYDPEKGEYVGTWIDSMLPRMWTYRGWLDAETDTLILQAEGPDMSDPGKTAIYQDRVRFIDPDHKRVSSFAQTADGKWQEFMSVNYVRQPPTAGR